MGMAEAAWDLVLDSMKSGRPISAAYSDIREAPGYRLALADARTAIDTGRFHLLRAADGIDSVAPEGRILEVGERAKLRGDAAGSGIPRLPLNHRIARFLRYAVSKTRSSAGDVRSIAPFFENRNT
uniref:Putative acyl-CoA dehydrogenase n=1 Tax=Streptomyces versipellis TaxID=67375 RepID=A0A0B6VSN8_9ACTN|nr:putative acyl-CoA dehydrogenase [Streptomyces versipellis]